MAREEDSPPPSPPEQRSLDSSWLYTLPALHTLSHVLGGLALPGLISLVLRYWSRITRGLWSWAFELLPWRIEGLGSLFDALTLSILLVTVTFRVRARRRARGQESEPSRWQGWPHAAKLALAITAFLLVFALPSIAQWSRQRPGILFATPWFEVRQSFLIMGTLYSAVAYVTTFAVLIPYLGYSRASAALWYGRQTGARKWIYANLAVAPGLIVLGNGLGMFVLFFVLRYMGWAVHLATTPRFIAYLIGWILLLYLTHNTLGRPKTETLFEYTEFLIKFLMPVAMGMTAFAPFFAFNKVDVPDDLGAVYGGLILFTAFVLLLALRWTLQVDWRILPRVLAIAAVLLVVDLSLAVLGELTSRVFG